MKHIAAALVAVLLFPAVASAQNSIAYRLGPGAQMTCVSGAPTHISTRGTVWCSSSDSNKLHYTDPSGTDIALGSGGGGGGSVSLTCGAGSGLTCSPTTITGTGTISTDTGVLVTLSASQDLFNKTLTSPVLSGTVTGTYMLGGTPTLTAPLVTSLLTETTTGIASAQTIGSLLQNTTASTSGAPRQDSPAIALYGTEWSGSASVVDGWHVQTQTNQNDLVWSSNLAGTLTRQLVFNMNQGTPGIYSGDATNGLSFGTSSANGTYLRYFHFDSNAVTYYGSLLPMVDNTFDIGSTVNGSPRTVITHNLAIQPQTVAGATSTTIAPSAGGIVYLSLITATNVTSLTVSAGVTDGQEIVIFVIEPATGSAASVPATWTGVSFAGTYTPTSTLGKHDVFTFTWNATASKWWERSRAIGASN